MIDSIELMTSSKIVSFQTHTTLSNMKLKHLQPKRPSSSKSPDAWRLSMPQGPGGPELRWIWGSLLAITWCCNHESTKKLFPQIPVDNNTHDTSSLHLVMLNDALNNFVEIETLPIWRSLSDVEQKRSSPQLQFVTHWSKWIPYAHPAAEHDTQCFSLNWEVRRMQRKAKHPEEHKNIWTRKSVAIGFPYLQ